MNIDYKIIWFEDQVTWFEEAKKVVNRIVEKHGFNFPEPPRYANSKEWANINFRDFDLILVDLKLDNEMGDSIIERIRTESDVYTEIVFYSSDGEAAVRKSISEKGIDGVYCSARDADKFEKKVTKVIETTIKKVQDINNMRGLIMAETSDIDTTMRTIIQSVIEKDSFGIKDSLTTKIFENVKSKVTSKKDDFDRFQRNGRIDSVIKDNLMFDTSQKILAIQFIIDSIDHEITTPHKGNVFYDSYSSLKQKRDLLAHVIEVYEEGKKKLKSGNSELEFTDEFCVEIRVQIKQHSNNLNEILNLISQ
jgi:CheY-like chemotaxis protein